MIGNNFIDLVTDVKAALLPGEALGDIRIEGNRKYVRAKATATIAQYKNVKLDTSDTSGGSVTPTTAATDVPVGVHLGSVSATTVLPYFWLCVAGISVTVNVQGTVTAGDPLASSDTAGALQTAPFTAATKQGVVAIALEANASGNANKLVRLQAG